MSYWRKKTPFHAAFGVLLLVVAALAGCMTNQQGEQMQKEIFDAQTRLLAIEHSMQDREKALQSNGDANAQRLASTDADLEAIRAELRGIHGDIDTLRVGVATGQLPGTDPDKGGSIGSQLKDLAARVATLEQEHVDLINAIQKAGIKTPKPTSDKPAATSDASKIDSSAAATKAKSEATASAPAEATKPDADDEDDETPAPKKPAVLTSVAALQKAFDSKNFAAVSGSVPALLKKLKGSQREKAQFLFAESLFKQNKMRDAALEFNNLIEAYPRTKHGATARLRIGDSFRALGDLGTAKVFYEELVAKFPKTSEAKAAKERLKKYYGETQGVAKKGGSRAMRGVKKHTRRSAKGRAA